MEKFIKYIGSILVAVAIIICLAGILIAAFTQEGYSFGYYTVRIVTLIVFAVAGWLIYKKYWAQ